MTKWLRLRDTDDEATLYVKQIISDAIDGTQEVETTVGDFAVTNKLLSVLGFTPKSYQENRRTSFALDGARLAVEGNSYEHVVRVAKLLGYDEGTLTGENTIKVYARHGIDLTSISDLRFLA